MTTTAFGPYRIEGLLGRGGMGEVYRAFDTRHNPALGPPIVAQHPVQRADVMVGQESPHIRTCQPRGIDGGVPARLVTLSSS